MGKCKKNFLYMNSNFWIGPQNKNAFHFFDILVFFDFFEVEDNFVLNNFLNSLHGVPRIYL